MFSSNSGPRLAAILALLLAGCASEAPPLPSDTTSVDRSRDLTLDDFTPQAQAMSCDDIGAERRQIADTMQTTNAAVDANRTRNQIAVGFVSFGGLVAAPALLASESNDAEKDQLTKLYERRDTLIKLATLKHCPTLPSS